MRSRCGYDSGRPRHSLHMVQPLLLHRSTYAVAKSKKSLKSTPRAVEYCHRGVIGAGFVLPMRYKPGERHEEVGCIHKVAPQ